MAWHTHHGFSLEPRWFPYFDIIDRDPAFCYPGLDQGIPLTETTVPPIHSVHKRAVLTSRHKALPDIFLLKSVPCVNQNVRNVIEECEPDVHQFFPISIVRKNGDAVDDNRYYLLNICQLFNSIVVEKSNLKWVKVTQIPEGYEGKELGHYHSIIKPELVDFRVVKKEIIDGKHLWREKIEILSIYYSDVLHQKFLDHKFNKISDWYKATEE